jgi:hypothetical protein
MLMKVTNQPEVMVMMVKLENQNLLNELVLEKIIFALAIENTMIEMRTINHHPKQFHLFDSIYSKEKFEILFTAKLEQ